MSQTPSVARLAPLGYPLAAALMFSPLLELAARLWPIKPYLVQWRFQAEIGVVNAAPVLLIGLLLVVAIAWTSESVNMLRVGALLAGLFGLVLAPAVALMLVDVQQVQQMAASNVRDSLRNNTLVTVAKGGLAALAALSLAVAAWRAGTVVADADRLATSRAARNSPDESDLLVVNNGE